MSAIHLSRRRNPLFVWVAMLVAAELFWLGLLWPLVPSTVIAWLVTLLMPLPISGYGYLVVRGIDRLSLRSNQTLLTRGLGVLLALSVGALICLALILVQHSLDSQFHYRYFH